MLCGAIPEPLDVYARQAQSLEGVVDIFDGFAGPCASLRLSFCTSALTCAPFADHSRFLTVLYHAAALAREAVTLFTGREWLQPRRFVP